MRRVLIAAVAGFGLFLLGAPAHAATKQPENAPQQQLQHWHFQGLFGNYDKATLQKGFVVYQTDCASCHGLRFVHYRDLQALGLDEQEVAALAAGVKVPHGLGGPGASGGKPKMIAATPNDRLTSPLSAQAAAKRFHGAVPQDLSLTASAAPDGAGSIYSLLTGYRTAPPNIEMLPYHYFNIAAPGMQTAMAPPLKAGSVTLANGKKPSVQEMAHDVAGFLAWTAETKRDDRKSTGYATLFFLLFLGILVYAARSATRETAPGREHP